MKTYMVAIRKTFKVTGLVYYEALAETSQAALREAKEVLRNDGKSIEIELLDDAKATLELDGFEGDTKPVVFSVGPASDYHSDHECKLCRKAKAK